jgi:hypothetical protein
MKGWHLIAVSLFGVLFLPMSVWGQTRSDAAEWIGFLSRGQDLLRG